MIAVDTSSFLAFFSGESGDDVEEVESALGEKRALLPPVVLTELLSLPRLPNNLVEALKQIPLVELKAGYWERAGVSRSRVLGKGFKARVADALIAQCCLDQSIPLITRDKDFRHFASLCGLRFK